MTESYRADTTCPHCGKTNDAHLGIDRPVPRDGDVGICWSCRRVAVFTVDTTGRISQRVPTTAEAAEFDADPRLRQMRGAMAESYRPSEAAELVRRSGEARP